MLILKRKKEERKDGGEKKAPSILHGGIWFTQVNQSTVVSVLYAVSIKLQNILTRTVLAR